MSRTVILPHNTILSKAVCEIDPKTDNQLTILNENGQHFRNFTNCFQSYSPATWDIEAICHVLMKAD